MITHSLWVTWVERSFWIETVYDRLSDPNEAVVVTRVRLLFLVSAVHEAKTDYRRLCCC